MWYHKKGLSEGAYLRVTYLLESVNISSVMSLSVGEEGGLIYRMVQ